MLHSDFEVSMLIRGFTPHILRQNSYFAPPPFGKEIKMLMVVDSSLLPLIFLAMYSSKLNEFQINIVFKEDVLIQRMCY